MARRAALPLVCWSGAPRRGQPASAAAPSLWPWLPGCRGPGPAVASWPPAAPGLAWPARPLAIGIDLGTTNSCIVVVEEAGNVVIADKQGEKTFPSVVYIGADGKPVIGNAARNRMGERPAPIATVKRKMGSTETVLLGGRQFTPSVLLFRPKRWSK